MKKKYCFDWNVGTWHILTDTIDHSRNTITYHNALCLSPQNLHKHCLQFLLSVKMAPRETEDNAYAKFGVTNKEHYGMLWHFWSGQL